MTTTPIRDGGGSMSRRARSASGLGWLVVCGAMVVALQAAAASPPEAQAKAAKKLSSCFWVGPFTSRRGPEFNYAFPDIGAAYWTARYTVPAGATLRLRGTFAHARYQSFHSYGAGHPVDSINDLATVADPGSTNPFLPGAARTAKRRSYAISISGAPPPTGSRAPNTLYAGVPGRNDQELIYRVYVPDKGRDYSGGVGLPEPELTLADGTVLRGDDLCTAISSTDSVLETSQLPLQTYLALRDQPGKPPTFPAVNPPRFGAFYNTAYTINCVYLNVCEPNPVRSGGQYSNRDIAYVGAFLNRQFGSVLVLRGKLPTTPLTYGREKRMGQGQLRYWSICQNESFATTAGAGCLYDEQVPIDKDRRYTIVTSLPADRPANAYRRCGVGFVPWPENGDGAGHPDDALLLIRNMLPSPSFHQAVQDTRVPGDEAAVMGPYLPTPTYVSKSEFEALGCSRKPGQAIRGTGGARGP